MNILRKARSFFCYAYFFMILCILPLYMKNKIYSIAEGKRNFLYICALLFLIPGLVLSILLHILEHPKEKKISLPQLVKSPDCFLLLYFLFLVVSTFLSRYRQDALYGADGWYMGLLTMSICCASYLLAAHTIRPGKWFLYAYFLSSGLISLLCIITRFGMDPLNFYGLLSESYWNTYLPFLGQKNWFACYLTLSISLGCGYFLISDNPPARLISSIYLMITFWAVILQDSDSIYVALACLLLFLFFSSCHNRSSLKHFLELIILILLSWQLMGVLERLFYSQMITLNTLQSELAQGQLTRLFLLLTIIVWEMLSLLPDSLCSRLRRWTPAFKWGIGILALSAVAGCIFLMYMVTTHHGGSFFENLSQISYLNFDDSWGTNRGQNWKYAVSIFTKEFSPLQKLIGIGPDCYIPYEVEYHPEYTRLWVSPIANAHNEFLTSLVNTGILGTISYYGFLVSCCVSALRSSKKQPILLLFPAAAVCICANNLFSFMTCISTPILFLLMGWLRNVHKAVSDQPNSFS